MEYFTLADDLEEINSIRAKKLKKWALLLIVVPLFFLLRSVGIVTIEYSKGYFVEKHNVNKEAEKFYAEGTKVIDSTTNSVITQDDTTLYRELGFGFRMPFSDSKIKVDNYFEDEKTYLEKIITEKFSKDEVLKENFSSATAAVQKLDINGLYWFPLIKNGKISYQAVVRNKYSQNTYSAKFSGEIELAVYGFCTTDRLKKEIAEKIGKVIVKSVKDDYKK